MKPNEITPVTTQVESEKLPAAIGMYFFLFASQSSFYLSSYSPYRPPLSYFNQKFVDGVAANSVGKKKKKKKAVQAQASSTESAGSLPSTVYFSPLLPPSCVTLPCLHSLALLLIITRFSARANQSSYGSCKVAIPWWQVPCW